MRRERLDDARLSVIIKGRSAGLDDRHSIPLRLVFAWALGRSSGAHRVRSSRDLSSVVEPRSGRSGVDVGAAFLRLHRINGSDVARDWRGVVSDRESLIVVDDRDCYRNRAQSGNFDRKQTRKSGPV